MITRVKLYRRRDDGSLAMVEVSPRSFACTDDFFEALDFYYDQGYSDTIPEPAVA